MQNRKLLHKNKINCVVQWVIAQWVNLSKCEEPGSDLQKS